MTHCCSVACNVAHAVKMPSSECVWEWPCCCKNKSVKQNYPFCQATMLTACQKPAFRPVCMCLPKLNKNTTPIKICVYDYFHMSANNLKSVSDFFICTFLLLHKHECVYTCLCTCRFVLYCKYASNTHCILILFPNPVLKWVKATDRSIII